MTDFERVTAHYTHGDLLGAITAGLGKLGKTPETVTVEDLAPVDEFHIGGSTATESFLDRLGIEPEDTVLDIGCGLGGSGRFAARAYGCRVTGIDLTAEYVDTGRELCAWVGLDGQVTLVQGDALATGLPPESFDKAFMLHVGMNIADKDALAGEVARVLKPGGTFGIYDVMRVGGGELALPVPWASAPEANVVASPDEYRRVLTGAGFELSAERDRRAFALEFFEAMQSRAAEDGPPPMGLHILMGETAPAKIGNMVENIRRGTIAPVELIARKAG